MHTVAKWLNELTLSSEKSKCMLMGSNRQLENKVPLTVPIQDQGVDNVCSFRFLGIFMGLLRQISFVCDFIERLVQEVETCKKIR